MSSYDTAYDLAVSALSWCAFPTVSEMEAAYKATALVIQAGLETQRTAIAAHAYDVVDQHLWDATIASQVKRDILTEAYALPPGGRVDV